MQIPYLVSILAIALAAASTGTLAHGGDEQATHHGHDASQVEQTPFGREGDPAKVSRTVAITMSDAMRFTPADLVVKKGETVKFVVSNRGQVLHEMVLGTPEALKEHAELMKKFPDMEHADANMAHVRPGKSGEIVWLFNRAGDFRYACLQPGHYEAGMVGKVVVK